MTLLPVVATPGTGADAPAEADGAETAASLSGDADDEAPVAAGGATFALDDSVGFIVTEAAAAPAPTDADADGDGATAAAAAEAAGAATAPG